MTDTDTRFKIENRWRIAGRLTLESDLRLGDGDHRGAPSRDDGQDAQVATIQRDVDGKPIIPGSSLKGVLRHFAKTLVRDDGEWAVLDRLFGEAPSATDGGRGGALEFLDCRMAGTSPDHVALFRDWAPERHGYARDGIAIDGATGTVEGRKLFGRDITPAGVCFAVDIRADNLEEADAGFLLRVLDGFNRAENGLSVGGGGGTGHGRATWTPEECREFGADAIKAYLASDGRAHWSGLPAAINCSVAHDPAALPAAGSGALAAHIALDYRLRFDAPFLVGEKQNIEGAPDLIPRARPRKDARNPKEAEAGEPELPATSVRGVLRARAERIYNTLAGGPGKAFPARKAAPKTGELTAAEALFGTVGHKGALAVSAPRLLDQPTLVEQEFVAIDRFTGGAAPAKKFKVQNAQGAEYDGALRIDLRLLEKRKHLMAAAVGLLGLTARDMIEGDLTFGHGAAKGYGGATVELTGLAVEKGDIQADWLDSLESGAGPNPAGRAGADNGFAKAAAELARIAAVETGGGNDD